MLYYRCKKKVRTCCNRSGPDPNKTNQPRLILKGDYILMKKPANVNGYYNEKILAKFRDALNEAVKSALLNQFNLEV